MNIHRMTIAAAGCAILLMASGCSWKAATTSGSAAEPGSVQPVQVTLIDAKAKAVGTAVLTPLPEGTKVRVEVTGLTPGKHGIHFHQIGKCEASDFKTAGDHFNPFGKKHGLSNPDGPHAGDMPNLVVGTDGKAKAEFVTKLVTLQPGASNSLVKEGGSAIVIHAGEDDQKTDPAGNSGARVVCGVIPAP